MNAKKKITLFYLGVAVLSALILAVSFTLQKSGKKRADEHLAKQVVEIPVGNKITSSPKLFDASGRPVSLLELEGKVICLNLFYASCPLCTTNNTDNLKKIYDAFRLNPDFKMVSISIDERDSPAALKDKLAHLEVDFDRWLFLTGNQEEIRPYLEKEIGFLSVKKLEGEEAERVGPYAHDMSLILIDKQMQIRIKRNLFETEKFIPGSQAVVTEEVLETIGALLGNKNERSRGRYELEAEAASPLKRSDPQK